MSKKRANGLADIQSVYLNKLRVANKPVEITCTDDIVIGPATIIAYDHYTLLVSAAITDKGQSVDKQVLIYKHAIKHIYPCGRFVPIDVEALNNKEG